MTDQQPSGTGPTEDAPEPVDNTVSDWAAYMAMTCALLAFLPSTVRIYQRKTSCDVSLFALALRVLAAGFWLYYAIANVFVPNMVSSSLSLSFTIIFLVVVVYYRKGCAPEITWNAKDSSAVLPPAQGYGRLPLIPAPRALMSSHFQAARATAGAQ